MDSPASQPADPPAKSLTLIPVQEPIHPTLDVPFVVVPSAVIVVPAVVVPQDATSNTHLSQLAVEQLHPLEIFSAPLQSVLSHSLAAFPLVNPIFASDDDIDEEIDIDSAPFSPIRVPSAPTSPLDRYSSLPPNRTFSDPFP